MPTIAHAILGGAIALIFYTITLNRESEKKFTERMVIIFAFNSMIGPDIFTMLNAFKLEDVANAIPIRATVHSALGWPLWCLAIMWLWYFVINIRSTEQTKLSMKSTLLLLIAAGEIHFFLDALDAGIYLFDREIFDVIRETPLSSRGEYEITDSISILGKEGPIGAIITNKWMSIENPIDLFNAQLFFPPTDDLTCMQFHSGGEIGFKAAADIFFDADTEIEFSSVKFRGPVVVGQGTLIVSGSVIGPRVFIGRNSEIGAKSTLKEALIMENVRIENECNLSSIIIGEESL